MPRVADHQALNARDEDASVAYCLLPMYQVRTALCSSANAPQTLRKRSLSRPAPQSHAGLCLHPPDTIRQ